MSKLYMFLCILVMAGVTYLIRMLPLTFFTRKIKSRFVKSFLFYVPYAVMSAMTFPAVFYATGNIYAAIFGAAVAVILAYKEKSLLTVAALASVAVFAAETLISLLGA